MSKNWLADSKLPKCGVRRRIGKPLDRVSHDATAHRAVASPFLILYESKGFRVRRTGSGKAGPARPKAFEEAKLPRRVSPQAKHRASCVTFAALRQTHRERLRPRPHHLLIPGRLCRPGAARKLFVHYFLRNDFLDSLNASAVRRRRFYISGFLRSRKVFL